MQFFTPNQWNHATSMALSAAEWFWFGVKSCAWEFILDYLAFKYWLFLMNNSQAQLFTPNQSYCAADKAIKVAWLHWFGVKNCAWEFISDCLALKYWSFLMNNSWQFNAKYHFHVRQFWRNMFSPRNKNPGKHPLCIFIKITDNFGHYFKL